MENNYSTKFSIGQRVKIFKGLYKGKVGEVTGYSSMQTRGIVEDDAARNDDYKLGLYEIKISYFLSVRAKETDIVLMEEQRG